MKGLRRNDDAMKNRSRYQNKQNPVIINDRADIFM